MFSFFFGFAVGVAGYHYYPKFMPKIRAWLSKDPSE